MACQQSYMPNYFAINDILSTEEPIKCTIEVQLPGLGFLDSSSQSNDLKVGSKLELPLWLAEPLKKAQVPMVSVDIPNIYKEVYREILEADADAIVLSSWNPFYYELGMHVRKLSDTDVNQITNCLLQTFKARLRIIMDWAQNPVSDVSLGLELPRLERDLFLSGRRAKVRLLNWMKVGSGNILPSEISTNLKKRKRINCMIE